MIIGADWNVKDVLDLIDKAERIALLTKENLRNNMKYTKSGELCLSEKDRNDLLNLIDHARKDISYKEGGTYYDIDDTDVVDTKAVKQSERAIDILKQIILQAKY